MMEKRACSRRVFRNGLRLKLVEKAVRCCKKEHLTVNKEHKQRQHKSWLELLYPALAVTVVVVLVGL